jgi:hypothetical protein
MDLESGVQSEVGVLPDKKHPPKKQSRVEVRIKLCQFLIFYVDFCNILLFIDKNS